MVEMEKEKKPSKTGGKKRKNAVEDGEERQRKKKGNGERDQGGGKNRLDAVSVGYFRRVGDRLKEGFQEDEERGKYNQ